MHDNDLKCLESVSKLHSEHAYIGPLWVDINSSYVWIMREKDLFMQLKGLDKIFECQSAI